MGLLDGLSHSLIHIVKTPCAYGRTRGDEHMTQHSISPLLFV